MEIWMDKATKRDLKVMALGVMAVIVIVGGIVWFAPYLKPTPESALGSLQSGHSTTKLTDGGNTVSETFQSDHSFTFVKVTNFTTLLGVGVQRVVVKRDDGALFSALAAWNERFYPGDRVMIQKLTYPMNLMNGSWETKMLVAVPLNPPPPDPNAN